MLCSALCLVLLWRTPAPVAPASGSDEHDPVREPLVFDLVRGLGAKQGELKANVLLRYAIAQPQLHWAPEIEWAFADGMAIELELSAVAERLAAVKLATQFTLPRRGAGRRFRDGVQMMVEMPLSGQATRATGLYIAGWRVKRASLLLMLGPRLALGPERGLSLDQAINFAAFLDLDARVAVGIELDTVVGSNAELTLMPQLHLQARRVRVQGGAGVSWSEQQGASVVFAIRLILD